MNARRTWLSVVGASLLAAPLAGLAQRPARMPTVGFLISETPAGQESRLEALRGAYFVDRLFKGAKPGDLPIEQATRFELVVNQCTAKALGIKIAQDLLLRVDRVIE